MNPMTEDEAHHILDPHLPALSEPVYAAWRQWEAQTPAVREPFSDTTRANMIYDWTKRHAKVTLDRPPFTLTEQPGFLVVSIEDRVRVRFKKLDERMTICGIRTDQFKNWRDQDSLPGFEPLTNIVVGYQVSEFGELESVNFVCSKGYSVKWSFEAPKPSITVATFPAPAAVPATKVIPLHPRKRDDAPVEE